MSGRGNSPTRATDELVEYLTRLRDEASRSREYRALERDFTALLNHHVFTSNEGDGQQIFVGGES